LPGVQTLFLELHVEYGQRLFQPAAGNKAITFPRKTARHLGLPDDSSIGITGVPLKVPHAKCNVPEHKNSG